MITTKKILVLGGTGLIGTELIKDFKKKGYFVANISKINISPHADVNHLVDLKQRVVIDIDVEWDEIFMLSSYSTSDKMDPIYLKNEGVNIKYLLNLHPQASFYYMSSYAAMDTTEYDPLSIRYLYRESKQEAEKILKSMHEKGYNVHSLRIPAVYGGESNDRSIYRIVEKLKDNIPVVIDNDVKICYTQDIVDFYSNYTSNKHTTRNIIDTIEAIDISLPRIVLSLKERLGSTSVISVKITDEEKILIDTVLDN